MLYLLLVAAFVFMVYSLYKYFFTFKTAWRVSVVDIYTGKESKITFHNINTANEIYEMYVAANTYGDVRIEKIKVLR